MRIGIWPNTFFREHYMFQRLPLGFGKLAVSWLGIMAILFIPFRPLNTEPVLAALMPASKRFGAAAAFVFAFMSIAVHDACTSGIGAWSWITAGVYGVLGIASNAYFRGHAASRANFLAFGLAGTLAFDALTGLTVGPLFYGQPFWDALFGQIPFTLMHLAGTAAFAITLSPFLYWWFEAEPSSALVRSRT